MDPREERWRPSSPLPSSPLLRTVVGDVLRRTRRRQGRTLAEVARASQVSLPYLSEVERGRKEASSEVLAAICDGLHITLSDLVTEVSRALPQVRTPQASVIALDAYRGRARALRPTRRHATRRAARTGPVPWLTPAAPAGPDVRLVPWPARARPAPAAPGAGSAPPLSAGADRVRGARAAREGWLRLVA